MEDSQKKQDIKSILEQAKTEVDNRIVAKEKAELKETKPKITDKDVFVNNPPRTSIKEETPLALQNRVYMKASIIDFMFGLLIGVIGTLILKQLL